MTKLAPAIVVEPTLSADFAHAKTYLHMAKLSMAQSAAFMILAGAELERLHKAHGVKAGRPNSANVGGIKWDDLVQRELGISETTSRRYREMFLAAKKRVPLLDAEELLKIPVGELPELKQQQLLGAVQKATDGQTAQQLMWDWGIAKKPQGSGAKGGKREKDDDSDGKVTPEMLAAANVATTETLAALLTEALTDKPWNAAEKKLREKLHGLLEDARAAVKETL